MNHYIPKEVEEAYDELMGVYKALFLLEETQDPDLVSVVDNSYLRIRASRLETIVKEGMQHIESKNFKKICKSHSDFYKRESEIIRLSMSKNFAYHTKRELEGVNITLVQSLLFKLLYTKKRE